MNTAAQTNTLGQHMTLILFSITLFLSASLMFAVQPMIGKMLLPLVGGTPSGWIVAMAFFQIMLLIGYLLAHALSKFTTTRHGMAYTLALLIGSIFMPLHLSAAAGGIDNPGAVDIFLILTTAVAVPFIALSATSSTLQRLFTTTGHSSAHDPYFLYAASNMGSFGGLLLYPLIIEPVFTLSEQAQYLMTAYILLIVLATACVANGRKNPAAQTLSTEKPSTPLGARVYLHWMALAFVPSSLLLGVTIYITTDIMSIPMIWVLPLCLYLLTFIIAFSKKPIFSLSLLSAIHPWVVLAAIVAIGLLKFIWLAKWSGILFYLAVFTIVALYCHLRLASLRPLDRNRHHLTGFYLMMSVGGALGGVLNAFIIPAVANRLIELPLMLVASLLLHPAIRWRSIQGIGICVILVITAAILHITPPQLGIQPRTLAQIPLTLAVLIAAAAFVVPSLRGIFKPASVMFLTACLFLFSQFMLDDNNVIHSNRNFYGTIRVYERDVVSENKEPEKYGVRFIRHGTTVHGTQIVRPEHLKTEPTAYFSKEGPLGDIFKLTQPKDVMVVGLGAGAMNCYNAPDRHFSYIELDPAMVETAQKHFSFLTDCVSASPPRIIVGDGRLELSKLKGEKFDLILLDAFSSDSVPTHLLTREAVEEYLSHLEDDGYIVFNLSNRYMYFESLFAALGQQMNLDNRYKFNTIQNLPLSFASKWIILARKGADFGELNEANGWHFLKDTSNTRIWTDDYSNIMSVIQFNRTQKPAKDIEN